MTVRSLKQGKPNFGASQYARWKADVLLLVESLEFHGRVRPQSVAIIDSVKHWTFDMLRCEAAGLANFLETHVLSGRVGVCATNHGGHVVALYAAAAAGIEVVEFDPAWSPTELSNALDVFNVTSMLADGQCLAKIESGRLDVAVSLDESPSSYGPVISRSAAVDSTRERVLRTLSGPQGTHIVSPTGGTSQRLKGVRISHRATVARIQTQLVEFGIPKGGRYLAATPLFHGGARSLSFGYLYAGATIQLMDRFDPELFLTLAEGASAAFCVPTMLYRLLRIASAPLNPSLRIICGGARLDGKLADEVRERLTQNLFDYYASVDTGPIAIRHPGEEGLPEGCVGRPAFGVDVVIVSPDAEGYGAVEVGGAAVADGFEGDVDVVGDVSPDEVRRVRPGDSGRIDSFGYLHLSGRLDDLIISGGVNVKPWAVERALEELPSVTAAAVFGRPDPEWGQEVVAAVIVDPNSNFDPAELRAALRQRLAGPSIPKRIYAVDSFPMTSLGKVSRVRLAAQIAEGDIS